jgi:hypothetical protein
MIVSIQFGFFGVFLVQQNTELESAMTSYERIRLFYLLIVILLTFSIQILFY